MSSCLFLSVFVYFICFVISRVLFVGADEGQCQDGRDMRDRVDSIGQIIGYVGATILVISVIMVAIRKKQ